MITIERLKEVLRYDATSGRLTWLRRISPRLRVGGDAGSIANGYVRITIDGKSYMAHRLAWLYAYGAWPRQYIDHINGNRTDNRLFNLRDVSQTTNALNRCGPSKNNKIGYLGVCWMGGTNNAWTARISCNGKKKHLGYFKTPELAHQAYQKAKAEYMML